MIKNISNLGDASVYCDFGYEVSERVNSEVIRYFNYLSKIVQENNTFVSLKDIEIFLSKMNDSIKNVVLSMFNPFVSISEFFTRILNLIDLLKEDLNELEKEYLFRFYTIFRQLQTLHTEFAYFQDLKTLHLFFKQLIALESLSFISFALKP